MKLISLIGCKVIYGRNFISANCHTIQLISHASKVMLTILQVRLQQYMNWELPDVQTGFRKGRGTRDQIANIQWIIEKAREFQKNIYFCFTDYAKTFDYADHNKLWKIFQEMAIPDHLTCLLRNLYAGQEATVSTVSTSWQIDEIDGGTIETVTDFIFLGFKITADGDCSHEIKRCLLLGRKAMTNLDSISKSRDITLPTKIHLVKAMFFQ